MNPNFDQFLRVLELRWISQQKTLEDVGQVTQVELVMKVNRSLLKGSDDILVKSQGRPDDQGCLFLQSGLKSFEMALEEGRVDKE